MSTTKLTLPTGQWIDVKDKLRVIDKRDVHTYSVDGVSSDGQTYRFNVVKHQIATAAVRIVGWSIKDEKDKDILWPAGKKAFKDRVDTIEQLDEDVFDGITDAISKFTKEIDAEADDEKKETPVGATDSGPTSPSAN